MPRKPTSDQLSKDAIAQNLTADLESLTQRAMQHENMFSNKINFYLVIVTASIGGLILASEISAIQEILLPLGCIVLLVLAIIGWVTLSQGLDLSASATFIYRRMGRIRQWFLDQSPDLYPYLPFNPGDDKPSFYVRYARLRSMESIVLIVNAVIAAAFGALLWLFFCIQIFQLSFILPSTPYLIALGIGVVIFAGMWMIELNHTKKFMQMKEEIEQKGSYVHFPSKELKAKFENSLMGGG